MNDTEKRTCDYCGEEHDLDELTATKNGDLVCWGCLDDHFFMCECCGEYVDADELISVDGGEALYCEDCVQDEAYQCMDCGGWFTRPNIYLEDPDHEAYICYHCADRWAQCDDCGRIFDVDEAREDDYCTYCPDCWEENHAGAIEDYDYKPRPEICRTTPGALLFGVELEVDSGNSRDSAARDVLDLGGGRVYCKGDGSLNDGFEIVSHPGDLAHHLREMRWADICRTCVDYGFHSHGTDTCGLHIHVGRVELGESGEARRAVTARLVVLTARLWPELTRFSRRTENRLRNWAARPELDLDEPDLDELETAALDTERQGRYQAVNLTNDSTIEFRLFRGTLRVETMFASLELVSNLCRYAMTHDTEQCRAATFREIVYQDPRPELVDYCRSLDLLPTPAAPRPEAVPCAAPCFNPA